MPFRIDKREGRFRLWNLHKKSYTKVPFKTKASAVTMAKQYIWFREKKRATLKDGKYVR